MGKEKGQIKLLVILMLIGAGYAFYHFMMVPVMSRNSELEQQISDADFEIRNKYNTILEQRGKSEGIDTESNKLYEISDAFYRGEDQEAFLKTINKKLDAGQVVLESATFDGLHEIPVEGYRMDYSEDSDSDETADDSFSQSVERLSGEDRSLVESMGASLNVKGAYEGISQFLWQIENNSQFIGCSGFTIEFAEPKTAPEEEQTEESPSEEQPSEEHPTEETVAEEVQDEQSKPEDTKISIRLDFVNLNMTDNYTQKVNPVKPDSEYVMPQEFVDGSYLTSPGFTIINDIIMRITGKGIL